MSDRILDGLISRFEGVVGRVLRRIARSLARMLAGRGSFTQADVDQLLEPLRAQWLQHVDREVLPAVSTVYRRASTHLAEQLAGYGHQVPDLSPLTAQEYLARARNRLVAVSDTVWESVRSQLVEGVQAGDSSDQLAARVQAASGFGEGRARTIARTEVVAANNAASLATALLADDGSMRKEWLATPDTDGAGCDERTREAHCAADGQTRPLTEPFDVGGSPLMFPGDPTGPADQVINCRCAPGYVFDEEPTTASAGDFHLPGKHDQSTHGRPSFKDEVYTSERIHDLYGDQIDELRWQDDAWVSVHELGEMVVGFDGDTEGEHNVFADLDADSARAFADQLEEIDEAAEGYDPDDPDAEQAAPNGLVGWLVADGKLVGYTPEGEILVRTVDDDQTGDDLADADGFDTDPVAAQRLADALRDMADLSEEITSGADLVTVAAKVASGDFHRPGGRDHDQSTHGRRRKAAPDGSARSRRDRTATAARDRLPATEVPDGSVEALARNTVTQLRQLARDRGIRVPSRARKADIIALLADGDRGRVTDELAATAPRQPTTPSGRPALGDTGVGQRIADAYVRLRTEQGGDNEYVGLADLREALPDIPRQQLDDELIRLGTGGGDPDFLLVPAANLKGLTQRDREAAIRLGGEDNNAIAVVGPAWDELQRAGRRVGRRRVARGDGRGLVVVAAAEVHTGAMVALIPAAEDAARLAVDGGEDPEQLHVTLAYLGDAANIPNEVRQRIVAAMEQVAASTPVGDADAFAVSAFNPGDSGDRDTCVVLGISGDGLEDVHGAVEEILLGVQAEGGFTLPEQHSPWIPHLTLQYTDDLSVVEQLTDRVGPIAFDRLRVAFAGENTDIPLGQPDADDDAEFDSYFAEAIEAFVQTDTKLREYWLHGEGAAKIRWGTGGDFTRCVRHLRKYVRDPEGLCAEYHHQATGKWPGEKKNHDSTEDAMAADTMPPPEAVPDVVEDDCPEGHHRMPDGECMPDTATTVDTTAQPGEHFHTRVMEGVSTGMRQFAPGAITWREVPFAYHWQYKSSAHSGVPETVQVGLVTRAEREGDTVHFYGRLDLRSPEGLDYARRLAEGFARWSSVGPDESLKDRNIDVEYVLVEEPDDGMPAEEPEVNELTFRAYRVAEVSAVSVPALADATVEPTQELVDVLTGMGVITAPTEQTTDEIVEEDADLVPVAAAAGPIVAGAYTVTIPDLPPAAWFEEPADVSPHGELRVEESGRIYGYLAPKGVAHRSFRNRRVEVPMGRVDYGGWMNKPWPVAEGHKVYVGVITMDCGHASTSPADWSYEHRREHYDNSCSVAAHARIGENRHGVWIAGALAPWIDAEKLGKMMSCQLSGDWAAHNDRPGWQDFIAALFVPVEGFPKRVPAATVRVADGALVASAVPVRFVHDGHGNDLSLRPVLERIARGIGRDSRSRLDALHARVHGDR